MVHLTLPFVALLLIVGSSGSWAKRFGGKGRGGQGEGRNDDVALNSIEQQPAKGQFRGNRPEKLAGDGQEPVQGAPGGDLPPPGDQSLHETTAPSAINGTNNSRSVEDEEFLTGGPSTFTVTSSEVGYTWDKLPYREKYQWNDPKAPCHAFKLQVPDERQQFSTITLCIFRPHLEFADDTDNFIHPDEELSETLGEQPEMKVFGNVKDQNGSSVFGKIVGTSFYGEVSIFDDETKTDVIYVVEEIKLLKKLMRHNEKILRNILSVMSNGKVEGKYNAVVTNGASLLNFLTSVNPSEFVRGSFLVFTTNRNSYITAGEPMMEVDDDGKVTFNAGGDKIVITSEGHPTVHLITGTDREYIFRPNGKTVVQIGNTVDVLEEHEGSVAVSAFTAESSYGCILPTPAFMPKRGGGYLCKVCLAVDNLFLTKYMAKLDPKETTVNRLGKLIDSASWIFRSTDWNGDGTPDDIGLDYDPQYDLFTYVDDGNETITVEELDSLYGEVARMDFADCCVAVAYTMKQFPGPILAKASVQSEKQLTAQNGVCGGQDPAGLANNLVLISANNKEGNFSRMTLEQLSHLTAVQVGRMFGSSLDGSGDDSCDTFKDKKGNEFHFLMWPNALRTITPAEKIPSNCTKVAVTKVLQKCKSACFDVDKHPFCGNGIVEDGEECDCGGEHNCTLQTCCYPRNGLHPCRVTGIGCKTNAAATPTSTSAAILFASIFALVLNPIMLR